MASTAWSGSFLLVVLGVIGAIGLCGLVVFILGWRGRRINDHPVCGACRFDLSGVVPASMAGTSTTRCPECGSLLNTSNSVRVGERVRRPIAMVVGLLLVLLSLGSVAYLGFVAFSSPASNPSKPTLVLRYEARYGGVARAVPALKELDARFVAGTLSDAEAAALVDQALNIQAHQGQFWLPEWGDLLLSANSAGKVAAAQLRTYARNAAVMDIACRKLARVGEPIPATLTLRGGLAHAGGSLAIMVTQTEIAIDDEPAIASVNQAMMGFGFRSSGTVGLRTPTPSTLGSKRITFRMRYEVRNGFQSTAEPDPSLTWDVEQTRDIEVVAAGVPLVSVVRDDALAEVLTRSIKPRDFRVTANGDGTAGFSIMIDYGALPTPISFEAFLRWPTSKDGQESVQESRMVEVHLPAGTNGSHGLGGGFQSTLPAVKLSRATVVLRPSLSAAERNSSVAQTWLGPDLDFPDTPVLDQRGLAEIVPD